MPAVLETPSRIWRRIEAVEDLDMPSLPSLPPFEDSAAQFSSEMLDEHDEDEDQEEGQGDISAPIHSTPTANSGHHTAASTIRPPASTGSSARFAHSIASRSSKSSSLGLSSSRASSDRKSRHDSFDVSMIPSLPQIHPVHATGHYSDDTDTDFDLEDSKESVPEVYLPPEEDNFDEEEEEGVSLTDALQSVSRTGSPPPNKRMDDGNTPKKAYDYSMSLRSEPKVCVFHVCFYFIVIQDHNSSSRPRWTSTGMLLFESL